MSDPVLSARAHLALAVRRNHGDAEVTARRQALAEAKLERHIREAVAAAPPLTGEQRIRLAAILLGGAA